MPASALASIDAIFEASGVDRLQAATYDETKHQRDADGRFASKNGGDATEDQADKKSARQKLVKAGKEAARSYAGEKAIESAVGVGVGLATGVAARRAWKSRFTNLSQLDKRSARAIFEHDGGPGRLSTTLTEHDPGEGVLAVGGLVTKDGKRVGRWAHTLRDDGTVHFDDLRINDPDAQTLGADLMRRQITHYRGLGVLRAEGFAGESDGQPNGHTMAKLGFSLAKGSKFSVSGSINPDAEKVIGRVQKGTLTPKALTSWRSRRTPVTGRQILERSSWRGELDLTTRPRRVQSASGVVDEALGLS